MTSRKTAPQLSITLLIFTMPGAVQSQANAH